MVFTRGRVGLRGLDRVRLRGVEGLRVIGVEGVSGVVSHVSLLEFGVHSGLGINPLGTSMNQPGGLD